MATQSKAAPGSTHAASSTTRSLFFLKRQSNEDLHTPRPGNRTAENRTEARRQLENRTACPRLADVSAGPAPFPSLESEIPRAPAGIPWAGD